MSVPSPFRLVADDLVDLDKKTRAGLQPLLDQLTVFSQQVVAFANSIPATTSTAGTFSTDSTGEASVAIKPTIPTQPVAVALDQISFAEGTDDIGGGWSWSWQLIGPNIRVLFQGLDVETKYRFAFSYR